MSFFSQFVSAKDASRSFVSSSEKQKNEILHAFSYFLSAETAFILSENEKDLLAFSVSGLSPDRLLLTEERIQHLVKSVEAIAALPDPSGKILEEKKMANALCIQKKSVPFGVIGIIYESRPNVTVDAAALCLKSGNALILKGGKEALHTNRALVLVLKKALKSLSISEEVLQFLDTDERDAALQMLKAHGLIDLVIPRGSHDLIRFVRENAKVPYIETGASVVHLFVDESADLSMATRLVLNAKLRRPTVCNALDTVLVHEKRAKDFLALLLSELPRDVELYLDTALHRICPNSGHVCLFASEETFSTEWLDRKMSLASVSGIEEALRHIRQFSLGHSEAIVTESSKNAARFFNEVDAACLYWNASPAFSDGSEFGLGAEMGISTQKLHARGPFALDALTTIQWFVKGHGQIRP